MPTSYYHGYAMPTYYCHTMPTYLGGSFFWRFTICMLALNFTPVIFATFFALAGVAVRVGLFLTLASFVKCVASSSFCSPCPLLAAKKWAAKHVCQCKPNDQQGEVHQCKSRGIKRGVSSACCDGPKRTKPLPATLKTNVEVWADAEAYHVTVDVPGIGPDDLAVTAQPWSPRLGELPRLTVQAATESARVHRSVALHGDADTEHAAVNYAHGQLKISVPRTKTHALSIPIQRAAAPVAAAPIAAAPADPPVLREVKPDTSNVPKEAAEEWDAEAQSENEWEELPQKE